MGRTYGSELKNNYVMSEKEAKEYIYVEGLNPFPGEKAEKFSIAGFIQTPS